jgi:rootletin
MSNSTEQVNTDFDDYAQNAGASNSSSNENRLLLQQILELRRRLDEDHQSYKRKLQHYQESQQKQAQLVAKLQQKVLQYKTKCNELELSVEGKNVELERIRTQQSANDKNKTNDDNANGYDIESLLVRIEEEQQKLALTSLRLD